MDKDRNGHPSSPAPSSMSCCALSATAKRQKFLRKIFKFRQMDFEYALWQMFYLFVAPQKVKFVKGVEAIITNFSRYRNFGYRKQTKNQWARDDPAFLILLTFWLLASSIGFSFALDLGVVGFFKLFLWVVFIGCIGVGLALATLLWFVTNRFLITQPPSHFDVEWGYCFDIHLNAFFPLLLILHFFKLPFLSYLIMDSYIACLVGNTIWLVAMGYYIYITFLGYSSLPFLKKTRLLLYPMTVMFILYIVSVVLKANIDRALCEFYRFRSSS